MSSQKRSMIESDRAAIAQPELFFPRYRDRLVVLDEVQHVPQLFKALRPEIDAQRRPGRFLLLGSASGELLRQTGESLAGRVSYVDLTPLLAAEVPADPLTLQALRWGSCRKCEQHFQRWCDEVSPGVS